MQSTYLGRVSYSIPAKKSSMIACMTTLPLYAQLYQVNTRLLLTELAQRLHRPATLDDISDAWIQELAERGFNWLYLLGGWDLGQMGRTLALHNMPLRGELQQVLPNLSDADIVGSCFAITGYQIPDAYGGPPALQRLRQRLAKHGLRLMMDFVANHTAMDHPWVTHHPEYYINGAAEDLARDPQVYFRTATAVGERILAHGKDPYFPAWNDTVQIDYSSPAAHAAVIDEMLTAAAQCDGLRVDMAMLPLPAVFLSTWGRTALPFWPDAIQQVRRAFPDFIFLGEVYWNLEWTLQQQGFDFTYDKQFYDMLVNQDAAGVKKHLMMPRQVLFHMAHFLENHDEARAAARFPFAIHMAAAALLYLAPGLRFFQHGQLQGAWLRVPMQLNRSPDEPTDEWIQTYYEKLTDVLKLPAVRSGEWQLLEMRPQQGTGSLAKKLIGYLWQPGSGAATGALLALVNFSPSLVRTVTRVPMDAIQGQTVMMFDHLTGASPKRIGDDLFHNGLILDMAPWGVALLEVR